MATVHDVAAYILRERGSMTAMKLQKLCFYSHAWHLVWDEKPLFRDRIEAWANGPVIRSLYDAHRGMFSVAPGMMPKGDPGELEQREIESIDLVLDFYASKSAHDLSELTHRERPWRDARRGMSPGERGNAEITDDAIFEYYDSLTSADA